MEKKSRIKFEKFTNEMRTFITIKHFQYFNFILIVLYITNRLHCVTC